MFGLVRGRNMESGSPSKNGNGALTIDDMISSVARAFTLDEVEAALFHPSSPILVGMELAACREFLHETFIADDNGVFSSQELKEIHDRLLAAARQRKVKKHVHERKVFKHSRIQGKRFKILDHENSLHDFRDTVGWPTSIPKFHPDASVTLEFDDAVFLTKICVSIKNVRVAPAYLELHAENEEGEWTLTHTLKLAERSFLHHRMPRLDYEKLESFYLYGDVADSSGVKNEEWEGHPLANPGLVIPSADRDQVAQRWKIKLKGEDEGVLMELFSVFFYGIFLSEAPPPPQNVVVTPQIRSAQISWDTPVTSTGDSSSGIAKYLILAHPGGLGSSSRGVLCMECPGTKTEDIFPALVPNAGYSFQVIAVGVEGQEGIPSEATPVHQIIGDWEYVLDDDTPRRDYRAEGMLRRSTQTDLSILDDKLPRRSNLKELESSEFKDKVSKMIAGDFGFVKDINSSRCITIYVSGTPEDTKSERDHLIEFAFPYARLLCQSKGLEFSAVDLHWGVEKDSSIDDDHSVVEIHLANLQKSIQNSAATGFLYFNTERYGHRPLPAVVGIEEMELLLSHIQDGPSKDVLVSWYARDENNLPPVYILQPVPRMAVQGYTFLDDPKKGVRGDQSIMEELVLNVASSHPSLDQELWMMSLSEKEVRKALLGSTSHDKITRMCVIRTIDGLDKALADEQDHSLVLQKARVFAAMSGADRLQMGRLRDEMYRCVANGDKTEVSLSWPAVGDAELSSEYLGNLSSEIIKKLEGMIENVVSEEQKLSLIEKEAHHHMHLALEKSRMFVSRENVKSAAKACIGLNNYHISVLCGGKGSGRTSLLCCMATEVSDYLPSNTNVVVRLCGATSESSNAREVLQSICVQIAQIYPSLQEFEVPSVFEELVDTFPTFIGAATEDQPLAIFLNGLENLSDMHNERTRPWGWLPRRLPPNVYLAVSTVSEASLGILQALKNGLPDSAFVEVPKLQLAECQEVLEYWMMEKSRTLTQEQMAYVDQYMCKEDSSISMVHLKLLFDRVVGWPSYEEVTELPSSVEDFINLIYDDLEKKHGAELVAKIMQLLLASKNGLTDTNIMDMISADDMILGEKGRQGALLQQYNPSIRRMPPLALMRLKRDLSKASFHGTGSGSGGYLTERIANDVTVWMLNHQQFLDVARERYFSDPQRVSEVSWKLAEYFNGDMAEQFPGRNIDPQPIYFGDGRTPSKQRLDELPWALLNSGEYDELADVLCDLEYVEAKCTAGLTFASDLLEEYTQAMTKTEGTDLGRLIQYHQFAYIWFQVLIQNPTATPGLASNYAGASTVAKDAAERWKSQTETRPWMKWHNAPREFDPIISTSRLKNQQELISCVLQPGDCTAIVTGNGCCTVLDALFQKNICEFTEHTDWVWDCCISPDSRLVLSVSSDCTGRIWTANQGRPVEKLAGHTGWILGCAWSPKDNVVVTVSTDRTGRLWNPYFGYLLGVLVGHQAPVKCCAFHPLGEEVFTAACDGEVISWTVKGCEVVKRFKAHSAAINCVAWSGNNDKMATVADDGTMVLWDAEMNVLHTLQDHTGPVRSCSFSSNGDEVVSVGADSFGYLYTVTSGELVSKLIGHGDQVTGCSWQGRYILTVSADGSAIVWEREFLTRGHLQYGRGPSIGKVSSLKFTGSTVDDLRLHVLDDQLRYYVQEQPFLGAPRIEPVQICRGKRTKFTSADLSTDASTWAYGTSTDFTFTFSSKSGKQCADLHSKIGGPNQGVAWHPHDNDALLIGGGKAGKEVLKLVNTKTKKVLCTFDCGGPIEHVIWGSCGQIIVATGPKSSQIWSLEAAGATVDVQPVATFGAGSSSCISSDSSMAAFVLTSDPPFVYSITNKEVLCSIDIKVADIGPAAFSMDGLKLFMAHGTQHVRHPSIQAYAVGSGQHITTFYSPYSGLFTRLAAPPAIDGQAPFVVAGDEDGNLMVLELQERT